MYRSVEKVVSEYVFLVGNFEFSVKGRIAEKLGSGSGITQRFSWTVSHFYKPSKDAAAYFPPKVECNTKEEAERQLYTYVRGFTDIAEANKFF